MRIKRSVLTKYAKVKVMPRKTKDGCVVFELHFSHDKPGGWSIRFVESEPTKEGRQLAIDMVLADIYKDFSDEELSSLDEPKLQSLQEHPSWEWLEKNRGILGPEPEADKPAIRGPKRSERLEAALDFLEGLE